MGHRAGGEAYEAVSHGLVRYLAWRARENKSPLTAPEISAFITGFLTQDKWADEMEIAAIKRFCTSFAVIEGERRCFELEGMVATLLEECQQQLGDQVVRNPAGAKIRTVNC